MCDCAMKESFFSYSGAAAGYLQHSKPVAFNSDKHGIVRFNAGDTLTQFGCAMQNLANRLGLHPLSDNGKP